MGTGTWDEYWDVERGLWDGSGTGMWNGDGDEGE